MMSVPEAAKSPFRFNVYRTVIEVRDLVTLSEGPILGTVRPVALDCGHVMLRNPTFNPPTIGDRERCHPCEADR